MSKVSSILDQYGQPMVKSVPKKPMALNGGWGRIPYDAADNTGAHTGNWFPYLTSPDVELNPWRDLIVSRVRDLVRNDGWAAGIITRILDNAIGSVFRPLTKPDYRTLAVKTGFAFDAQWASEWSSIVDSHWRSWANDDGRYCDTGRRLTFTQMMYAGMCHSLIDGDAVAMVNYIPERLNQQALYATSVQLIDPDRLSNPNQGIDEMYCRGGVKIDRYGAPVGYYFREAHISDYFALDKTAQWEYIDKETEWGRPNIVHYFESDRASEHRGGAGILTPIVQRLKMITKYDQTEMDAAILNAFLAAYLESPFDPVSAADALGVEDDMKQYQANRSEYHQGKSLTIGDMRIHSLFPGEKINTISATHPHSQYKEFLNTALRNIAAGTGVTAQQVSNDWSDVNYSSARAAALEGWKTLTRRRDGFARGFASPIRSAWLEECCMVNDLPWPKGVNDEWLINNIAVLKTPISNCQWLGPGRGWIDPVAEKQGSVLGMEAGLSTLQSETAENAGGDWEEMLDQRAIEIKRCKELGIPLPAWTGPQQDGQATSAAQPPQKPTP
ncbi:phage portal protein [Commensalibacter oyaizuii]|uniref:Phage portal protein n=1 Tax=Commensalibacter oyaizuii TaxID=3043873 RepID=A0ABT6Q3D4_9PROT|nr:phage portal protein [Commensalibacter sp. TBRC 16381]MDI2091613.1 phage portal protein [Commensalibacter sp. TBRC 16381]